MDWKTTHPFSFFLMLTAACFLFACGDGKNSAGREPAGDLPESFSFLDVGVNTDCSRELRTRLAGMLGDDATQGRTVIDLETNYPGFLDAHFPDLADLNRGLNYPPRERVEHPATRLIYRFAGKMGLDFNYVEILHSDQTLKPLVIRVNYLKEHPEVLETLTGRYGAPSVVPWDREGGPSYAWRKGTDLMIVSLVPDQFGNPATQVVILFEKRIAGLLDAEGTGNRGAATPARGKTPF
jgi:hypothetical protein